MTLLVEKGFRLEDFANLHPGGKIGKRLMRVDALMHAGAQAPIVSVTTPMREVIYEMSRQGLGMTCVVDANRLAGIITDGDLRRRMSQTPSILDLTAEEVMTRNPVTIAGSLLAAEALNLMEQRKITSLIVTDADRNVEGVLHLHDLWETELF
jgi:arabinose-5-phosphate isomerase